MSMMLTVVLPALLEAAAITVAAFPPRFRLNRRLPELPEGFARD